jgi:short-subunit dehydrogenase
MIKNQNKIWITGASSGIGKALALKFSKENWKVAISARREKLLNEIAQTENISSFPLDVTDEGKAKEVFSNIISEFKNLDLCIFCSGAYDPKLEKEVNNEQIKKIMNINFFGVLNCIKTVEEYFKNKKQGHISIVSSIAAYRGLPNSSGYGPSKAALTNLTESLYFDFKKHNVRISLISPGFIKTQLTSQNTFNMPFIKSSEFAANKIYNGVTKGSAFEIHFPIELTLILKFLRILPYRVYLFLIDKFVKRD